MILSGRCCRPARWRRRRADLPRLLLDSSGGSRLNAMPFVSSLVRGCLTCGRGRLARQRTAGHRRSWPIWRQGGASFCPLPCPPRRSPRSGRMSCGPGPGMLWVGQLWLKRITSEVGTPPSDLWSSLEAPSHQDGLTLRVLRITGRPLVDRGAWGWRCNQHGEWEPKGDRVGWRGDGDHVYLDPDASYAAVQRLGQEVGDRLSLTPQTLRKRLKERGMLVTTDTGRQVLTVRRTLEGQRREVLHLS